MKIFTWLISAVLALVVLGFAFTYFSPDYALYLVRSGSMTPTIRTGDLIITGPVNGPINGEIKSGTIITYRRPAGPFTHRVIAVDGETLGTKGDAVEDADPWSVSRSDVLGVYLFKIPYVGYLAHFVGTKLGWFLAVIVPAVLLVAWLVKDILKEAFSNEPKTL